jgi:hypothetical protein
MGGHHSKATQGKKTDLSLIKAVYIQQPVGFVNMYLVMYIALNYSFFFNYLLVLKIGPAFYYLLLFHSQQKVKRSLVPTFNLFIAIALIRSVYLYHVMLQYIILKILKLFLKKLRLSWVIFCVSL